MRGDYMKNMDKDKRADIMRKIALKKWQNMSEKDRALVGYKLAKARRAKKTGNVLALKIERP